MPQEKNEAGCAIIGPVLLVYVLRMYLVIDMACGQILELFTCICYFCSGMRPEFIKGQDRHGDLAKRQIDFSLEFWRLAGVSRESRELFVARNRNPERHSLITSETFHRFVTAESRSNQLAFLTSRTRKSSMTSSNIRYVILILHNYERIMTVTMTVTMVNMMPRWMLLSK